MKEKVDESGLAREQMCIVCSAMKHHHWTKKALSLVPASWIVTAIINYYKFYQTNISNKFGSGTNVYCMFCYETSPLD